MKTMLLTTSRTARPRGILLVSGHGFLSQHHHWNNILQYFWLVQRGCSLDCISHMYEVSELTNSRSECYLCIIEEATNSLQNYCKSSKKHHNGVVEVRSQDSLTLHRVAIDFDLGKAYL